MPLDRLLSALRAALPEESAPLLSAQDSIIELVELMRDESPAAVLAKAALFASKQENSGATRTRRGGLDFLVRFDLRDDRLVFTSGDADVRWALSPQIAHRALCEANFAVEAIHDISLTFGVELFELLGLRNLSATMGEIFAREVYRLMKDRLLPNPNQDGYPDLIALTPKGVEYVEKHRRLGQMSDKSHWSPFPFGGVEVKSTCGNTPPASEMAKPSIGESRLPILVSAEWKAHHRETNNLLGVYWDFVDGLPTFLAIFFRNDLVKDDWGRIVQPREGGGRTTSVSIMKRKGVRKMGAGWLVLPDDDEMLARLGQRTVFAFGEVRRAERDRH